MSSPSHSSASPEAENGREVYDGQATPLDAKQTRAPGVQPVIAVRQLTKYYILG
jgi:hypothetical protein